MSSERRNEEALFKAARKLKSPAEQEVYLREACAGDETLLKRVQALIESFDNAQDFLESPPVDCDVTLDTPLAEGPGTVIGPYKLLEKIGEGGMAVVYMAEQERPLRRRVALKIIKLGMDTQQVIARFEAERQALAIMDHPNIAKVFDAGATDTGRPYFVMELVHGISMTEFCDEENLPMQERLTLFLDVCNGVQHAHQRGIIHRDLKPSNIMVTMHDDRAVPKVIDFGIAKATNQQLTEKTLFTRYAHMIGTPAYMSPEQAQMSGLDIDTRSDIYSLGVLLYELLTGTVPFRDKELLEAGFLEMQRIISEEEPIWPSTKLSTLGDTLTEIAKQRCCTPDILRKTVRGDLDWIVMKSLDKNRTRRYETASSFRRDVQHYLDHEPVDARKPSIVYGLRKYLYRHRSQVLLSLAGIVLICAVIAVLVTGHKNRLHRAAREALEHQSVLSDAREAYAGGDPNRALTQLKLILPSRSIGAEARLLYAGILVDSRYPEEARRFLRPLFAAQPTIAGAAHALWARIILESDGTGAARLKELKEHQDQAEALLPATAEAYFLRAMMESAIKEKLIFLDKALDLDRGHYESCRLRAFIDYAAQKYDRMQEDTLLMIGKRPQDSLGYALRARAQEGLKDDDGALVHYQYALRRTSEDDAQYPELCARICTIGLRCQNYDNVIIWATEGLKHAPNEARLRFHVFCALTARGDYERADALFAGMISSNVVTLAKFRDWSRGYVFDSLDARQSWHAPGGKPQGVAFLPLLEAEEHHDRLSDKAERIIRDGFTARWSPDSRKLAYGLGMLECSGIAVYDLKSQETELLVAPAKDPAWSPDGRYIAYVRNARNLPLSDLAIPEHRQRRRVGGEVWIMEADGTKPRHLAQGYWPSWSWDSKRVYYLYQGKLRTVAVDEPGSLPSSILTCSGSLPSISPNEQYVAYVKNETLHVVDLASRSQIAQCSVPPLTWGGHWSPNSRQFSLGSFILSEVKTGLWIYDLGTNQITKTLGGMVTSASWNHDGSKLAICTVGSAFEIWLADVDPSISEATGSGSGSSYEAHFKEMVDFYTRRLERDDNDIAIYLRRAECHHYLRDQKGLRHDMHQHITALGSSLENEFQDVLFQLWQSTPAGLDPRLNSSDINQGASLSLSPDNRALYFNSNRPQGSGNQDLWMTSRDSQDAPWQEPINLGLTVNSPADDWTPDVSSDGLSLYFASNRAHGLGDYDIYVSTRPTTNDPWGDPVNLGPTVNSPKGDGCPSISADGLSLFFGSFRVGGHGDADLWVTTRATLGGEWNAPVNLGPLVNGPGSELDPDISSDGLMLLFSAYRPDGAGGFDIWMIQRTTLTGPWGRPVNLGPSINKQGHEAQPALASDNSTLYFYARRSGDLNMWQVPFVTPPKDARENRKEE
jgi:serine/threonine protein kinase/Tol biopolymer transport system component